MNAMEEDPKNDEDPRNYVAPKPGKLFAIGLVGAAVLIVILAAGLVVGHGMILQRQTSDLAHEAEQGINVLVAKAYELPASRTLDLPATIHGYIEAPMYAKVAGYLKTIMVDKGDRVRRGQLLAILETPELDKQVADAKANYWLQAITDKRDQALVHQQVIAQQNADNQHSAMLQAKATYEQLLAEQGYKVITAQFDGIISARFVDPGALIPQSTASISGTPIVSISSMAPLRIYAYVPQNLALFIKNGEPATITLYEIPGRVFKGPIIRHPEALDTASRTMLVEVDLPNTDLSLYPGMYARLSMVVDTPQKGQMVRDDALVFRSGKIYVPVVRQDRLHLVEVTLGYDNGQKVVVNGDLRSDDLVALNVGQAAEDGEVVHPVQSSQQ
jgi:membrane fusion protein, multidrug efflux system